MTVLYGAYFAIARIYKRGVARVCPSWLCPSNYLPSLRSYLSSHLLHLGKCGNTGSHLDSLD